jgi:hypothetical protein
VPLGIGSADKQRLGQRHEADSQGPRKQVKEVRGCYMWGGHSGQAGGDLPEHAHTALVEPEYADKYRHQDQSHKRSWKAGSIAS